MSAAEHVEGEVVEHDGRDNVAHPPAVTPRPPLASTLFRTDDPVEVITRAQRVAQALAPVIKEQHLYATIKGKRHITIEGWQTLGAMLGVTSVCTWTRKLTDDVKGWEARCEARTLDGRVIGAAESQCDRHEGRWTHAEEHAIRSMAQTRAASKALASELRFIPTLAGFSGTPAEEMPQDSGGNRPPSQPPQQAQAEAEPSERSANAGQKRKINAKASERGLSGVDFANCLLVAAGQPSRNFPSEEAALRFAHSQVERWPARLVDAVLAQIAEASSE